MPQKCLRFYSPVSNRFELSLLTKRLAGFIGQESAPDVEEEACFYVIVESERYAEKLLTGENAHLAWLLSHNVFEPQLSTKSKFRDLDFVVEIGPRLNFTTPFSTNAVSACNASGLDGILRIEKSRRYKIGQLSVAQALQGADLLNLFGDQMTECLYDKIKLEDFTLSEGQRESFFTIDLLGENGAQELDRLNEELGLAFDESDKAYYLDFFRSINRSPTDVELFDLAQCNSEHSRHWLFRGKIYIDGNPREKSLFKCVQDTQRFSNKNNVIAFCDNSSAIHGFKSKNLLPVNSSNCSKLKTEESMRHIIYTAETHNFPTGVSPFPGASTGTGGRIRDVHSTGRGSHEVAGLVGYSVGNLYLDKYRMPWEKSNEKYPKTLAHPQKVLIEASNGASDYGNKFGEPVIGGFCRSFGMRIGDERIEYVKPILFSGGIGLIDDELTKKQPCEKGQHVAKIGGPVYRIGLGGGAASSVNIQGGREAGLDYSAVQRGDPEMEQKLHRFVRACVEMGEKNPILSIHDQGAGGNGNVLKELVEGENGGAIFEADKFQLGDPTLSVRELWGAEYQESDAILLDPKLTDIAQKISERERCPLSIVGTVTGKNKVILKNFKEDETVGDPVNLDLLKLGEREPKEFHFTHKAQITQPLSLPKGLDLRSALDTVLRLPSIASKRFLTNKVDRSVTGLVVQQQCVGPLHTPLADVSVTAHSYWSSFGAAMAVGEQPIKGLVDCVAGGQMAVAEALTNLVFAPITCLADVKCSGNWMWAAKLENEGDRLVQTCDAMCDFMSKLGIAIDGGKDSLSMATHCEDEVVKAPGTLVVTAYAPCTDIYHVLTPNLKAHFDKTTLIFIRMNSPNEHWRLGGSALAQCYNQIGDTVPKIDDPAYFRRCFETIQQWVHLDFVLAGHDVSDGGVLVAALEMAFAGNRSLHFNIEAERSVNPLAIAFSEESGVLLEVEERYILNILRDCAEHNLHVKTVGSIFPAFGQHATLAVSINGVEHIYESLGLLREAWEETSDRLELLQTSEQCVKEQIEWRKSVGTVYYHANFEYGIPPVVRKVVPKVAILREEGSNGDREMAAAFMMAGFEAYDVTMTDLISNRQNLDSFNGLAFVGGFSYADTLGSAKGWASTILFNKRLSDMFRAFRNRRDSFSLGVCNGCQLMALLGWVGSTNDSITKDDSCNVFMEPNACGRFHSGFSTLRIEKSPAIMLKDMQDSVLGCWSSHAEGKFAYRTPNTLNNLKANSLVSFRYTDGHGQPTQVYPANPNGSEDAVAGLTSHDGRHLCLMPHPDRSFLRFQWPDYPHGWAATKKQNHVSPWIKMFENALQWSLTHVKAE